MNCCSSSKMSRVRGRLPGAVDWSESTSAMVHCANQNLICPGTLGYCSRTKLYGLPTDWKPIPAPLPARDSANTGETYMFRSSWLRVLLRASTAASTASYQPFCLSHITSRAAGYCSGKFAPLKRTASNANLTAPAPDPRVPAADHRPPSCLPNRDNSTRFASQDQRVA